MIISPSSFLLLIYILLNDEIIQYIIPQQLCCLKKIGNGVIRQKVFSIRQWILFLKQ